MSALEIRQENSENKKKKILVKGKVVLLFQKFQVKSKLHNCTIAQLHNCTIAQLHNCTIAQIENRPEQQDWRGSQMKILTDLKLFCQYGD